MREPGADRLAGPHRRLRDGGDQRDVIDEPGVWIVGDKGTLLTTNDTTPQGTLRRVDLRTECDLVSIFARKDEVWIIGRAGLGGAVWQLRTDGSLIRKWGGC